MIRNASVDDVPRIAEIQTCGWRYAYRGLIPDHELFAERLVSKAMKAIAKRLENNQNIVVYEDDKDEIIKGFALFGNSRDDDKKNASEIYALYVQPEFTRLNVGKQILEYVINIAKNNNIGEIIIWVLDGNEKGIMFYKKNNFFMDGKQKLIEKWNRNELRMFKNL